MGLLYGGFIFFKNITLFNFCKELKTKIPSIEMKWFILHHQVKSFFSP